MKGLRRLSQLAARLGPTDEQLMWRVRTSDDHAAFALLVDRWRPRLVSLGTRMLGDTAIGEDMSQMAFTRVFQRRGEYQPTARFSTYLWRVAINLCHDELRRRASRHPWPGPNGGMTSPDDHLGPSFERTEEAPGPDSVAASDEEGALVRRALLRLSEPLRAVIVLRHYEDLKLREIAEVLGIPEGTVNSRMAEALSQLARELAPVLHAPTRPRHHSGAVATRHPSPPP